MSLLRKGSSRISEDNFNCRLQRENAKTGAVAASLAWNDPSDLDLHAMVILAKGGCAEICYRNKKDAGGYLDVDMHARDEDTVNEPVENIFWSKPPAGVYSIRAHLYKKRGSREAVVPFRALLKRDGEEDLSREGAVMVACPRIDAGKRMVECFRFTVDDDGGITMGTVGTPLPAATPARQAVPMRAMRVAGPKAKAKAKAMKVMKVIKTSAIAKGKKARVKVYRGQKVKTVGGLKKDDLVKNRHRKIVSAKKSQIGKDSKWAKSVKKAHTLKGYLGFKSLKKGTSFYEKAKEVLAEM